MSAPEVMTDEELQTFLDRARADHEAMLNLGRWDDAASYSAAELAATFRRLLKERDEARRGKP